MDRDTRPTDRKEKREADAVAEARAMNGAMGVATPRKETTYDWPHVHYLTDEESEMSYHEVKLRLRAKQELAKQERAEKGKRA